MKLKSKYFKLEEFLRSETAEKEKINNIPREKDLENLQWLCIKILDPLRNKLGKPVYITSGYRSIELNKVIGGATNPISKHTEGKASDIKAEGMTAKELFDFIINETKLPYDKVILEFDKWVHITYDRNKKKQRGIKEIAVKENGKTVYKLVE